uniref:Uncharacterized protein n=1 Tax=viral metagenome TaxID=1070528 RepID=A0A6C0BI16_9ZZZZ
MENIIVDIATNQFYARLLAERRTWIINQLKKIHPNKKIKLDSLLNDYTMPDMLELKPIIKL